jgi:hypothetical protein
MSEFIYWDAKIDLPWMNYHSISRKAIMSLSFILKLINSFFFKLRLIYCNMKNDTLLMMNQAKKNNKSSVYDKLMDEVFWYESEVIELCNGEHVVLSSSFFFCYQSRLNLPMCLKCTEFVVLLSFIDWN